MKKKKKAFSVSEYGPVNSRVHKIGLLRILVALLAVRRVEGTFNPVDLYDHDVRSNKRRELFAYNNYLFSVSYILKQDELRLHTWAVSILSLVDNLDEKQEIEFLLEECEKYIHLEVDAYWGKIDLAEQADEIDALCSKIDSLAKYWKQCCGDL